MQREKQFVAARRALILLLPAALAACVPRRLRPPSPARLPGVSAPLAMRRRSAG